MWGVWAYVGARVLSSEPVQKAAKEVVAQVKGAVEARKEKRELEKLERQVYKRALEELGDSPD